MELLVKVLRLGFGGGLGGALGGRQREGNIDHLHLGSGVFIAGLLVGCLNLLVGSRDGVLLFLLNKVAHHAAALEAIAILIAAIRQNVFLVGQLGHVFDNGELAQEFLRVGLVDGLAILG